MGLFNLFKKKPETSSEEIPQPVTVAGAKGPLGINNKSTITVDPLLGKTHRDFVIELPLTHEPMPIDAIGKVHLGEITLHRFYAKDDYWYQIKESAGSSEYESVDEILMFAFGDVLNPTTQEEFEQIANKIGRETYEYADFKYTRVFGTPGIEFAATADFDEQVTPETGDSYTTHHQTMLYAREVPGADRQELLLISVETDSDENISIVHSIGLEVFSNELTIL